MIILSFVVTLIPVIVSLLYFSFVISVRLTDEAERSIDAVAAQLAVNITNNMMMLNNTAYYLMANNLAQEVMGNGTSYIAVSQLERQIETMITYNDAWSQRFIQSLYLYRSDGTVFATMRESIYAGVRERNRVVYASYSTVSSTRSLIRPPDSSYCYYLQDYYQIDTQKKLGKLLIEVNPTKLLGDAPLNILPKGSVAFLHSVNGTLLYTTAEASAESDALYRVQKAYDGKSSHSDYHVSLDLGRYHMHLDVLVPYNAILKPIIDTRSAYFLVQVLVLLLMILLISLINIKLLPQSHALLERLEKLAGGDFNVKLPPSPYKEYDLTARAFNQTIDKLGTLFHQASEAGTLLSQAEYQMLESQINPHFIMNVLETINMQCLLANQQDTAALVVNLGMLLQSNVVMKHKQRIPLYQELDYVRYYLALQKARFEKLSADIAVEDEHLLQCLLPKLTIQPIVENCFVHGLEASKREGRVAISIWQENNTLMIRVSDNGCGFDASKWKLLNPSPEETQKKRSGIALRNIQRRIELLYGQTYGLQVSSERDVGTIVVVTLPLEWTDNQEHGEDNDA